MSAILMISVSFFPHCPFSAREFRVADSNSLASPFLRRLRGDRLPVALAGQSAGASGGALGIARAGLRGIGRRTDGPQRRSPGANRQRIVELFPTAHRRVSVTPNRQRIVEIGGGNNASSCVEVTPGAAVAVPQQGLRRGEMGNELPRNSRRKRTVGCTWGVNPGSHGQFARPRRMAEQPTLLDETSAGSG
jgi:hypothetical protein